MFSNVLHFMFSICFLFFQFNLTLKALFSRLRAKCDYMSNEMSDTQLKYEINIIFPYSITDSNPPPEKFPKYLPGITCSRLGRRTNDKVSRAVAEPRSTLEASPASRLKTQRNWLSIVGVSTRLAKNSLPTTSIHTMPLVHEVIISQLILLITHGANFRLLLRLGDDIGITLS